MTQTAMTDFTMSSRRKRIAARRRHERALAMLTALFIVIVACSAGFAAGAYYGETETLKQCAEEVYIKHGGTEYQCRPIKKYKQVIRK